MMNSYKGMATILLAVTLSGALLTACSIDSSSGGGEQSSGKVEEIVFALPSFNRIPEDLSKVTKAINAITVDKIGVKIDYRVYGPADYTQKVNLALQSGEKMDVFTTLGQFSNYVSKSQVAPLDDLIDQYGQEMTAVLEKDFGPDLLKATTINGKLYGIPVNKGMALPISFVYNSDMLKQTGFNADSIKSVEDLPAAFEAVKKANPDVIPFGPINVNPSDTNLINLLKGTYKIDFLTDTTGVGVVVGGDGKVVNFYETDIFKNGSRMIRDWYTKGYLEKDAATTAITSMEMLATGREFSFLGGYSGKEIGKTISVQSGKNIEAKRIAPFYFDTNAVNAVSWMVSSTSKAPEAAVKFLNLLYTDEKLINTILYGIEGEDYVKVDAHHVKFPEGKDSNTVAYTAMFSTGVVGSESLQYQFEGVSWSDIELKLRENKETERSPYFGFIFDQSRVKTQISAVTNVVNQYLPGLVTGSIDPETYIPKFIKDLNAAGAADIIKSKQEQLDKWLSSKGK